MPFASWLPTDQRVTGWLKNKYTPSWCKLTEMEAIHLRFSELEGQSWGESNWCLGCKLENDWIRGPFTQMAPRVLFSALYLLCRKKQKSIMKHSGQKTKPEKFLKSRLRNKLKNEKFLLIWKIPQSIFMNTFMQLLAKIQMKWGLTIYTLLIPVMPSPSWWYYFAHFPF